MTFPDPDPTNVDHARFVRDYLAALIDGPATALPNTVSGSFRCFQEMGEFVRLLRDRESDDQEGDSPADSGAAPGADEPVDAADDAVAAAVVKALNGPGWRALGDTVFTLPVQDASPAKSAEEQARQALRSSPYLPGCECDSCQKARSLNGLPWQQAMELMKGRDGG
jgi:hypothetical protein